jgi:hypothetical protein
MVFENLDLGGIQEIIFPVVKQLTGLDISGNIAEKSVALDIAGDELINIGNFVKFAGAALSDGILDNHELNTLVADCPDIRTAVARLREVFYKEPVE